MACRLDGAKPLSKPMLECFIQENALEDVVCEMASILSLPQCVKKAEWHSDIDKDNVLVF